VRCARLDDALQILERSFSDCTSYTFELPAATQGIESKAYHEAMEAAAAYDDIKESLTDVITQARDLRTRIPSAVVTEKDARKLLADLRKHCTKLVAKIAPTKSKHDSAQATLKDPAAKREALIARFPALRR
jgi:phage shock protein A